MNMVDVNEVKKQEALKAAIPEHVKKDMDSSAINQMIQQEMTKKNQMESDDFSKFLRIEKLPSKYLRYPEGTVLYGRPLLIPQLKKISNMTVANAAATIDDILKSSVRGMAVKDILISDKLYILLWLRANTYPESGYSVPFTCSECSNESSYDFKVDDIEINYIREDMRFEEPLELSTGDVIVFKYPTINDETRVQNFRDSVKRSYSKYDEDTLSLTMPIDEINGKKMTVAEMYDFISDTKIYSQIKGYVSDFNFGISNILNVKCNICGGMTPTGLSFREDFLIPPYRFTKSSRNAVSNK